jgi:dipeptidyl aminopeptidase/acylaminoacyl peptidase
MWWEGWLATYLTWGQYLATSGYAVFMPNHRGSIGQGCEFAEAHYRDWGRGDYQDMIDGLDILVEQGIADPNRLAVGGGSFGGYLAAWAVTQTDRFRACVVESGWTDLISFNLTTDAPDGLCKYMGGDELELAELYESRSPLAFVRRCSTPTLLLHGEDDRRAPADQARAFHRALELCGVESELVIYANEGHVFEQPENQLDSLLRVRAWLDRFLLSD